MERPFIAGKERFYEIEGDMVSNLGTSYLDDLSPNAPAIPPDSALSC